MSNVISIYEQTAQPRMLLVEDKRPKLLQERYFPTVEPDDLFDAGTVTLDFDEGDFMAGAFVKKGYKNGDTSTYFANNVVPPRIGLSDEIDTSKKDRELFESLCRNDLSPSHAEAQDALLRIKGARIVNRASRSIEILCAMSFQNNAIQFTCDNSPTDSTQVTIDIEYYDGSHGGSNPQVYTPTVNWGSSGATPYADVCAMVVELMNNGGEAEDLLMSEKMWGYLKHDMFANEGIKDQINYTVIANGDKTGGLFSKDIKGAQCVGVAQFDGHPLNLITYTGGYKETKTGPFIKYLPDDFACVTAPNCGRTLCAACSLPNPMGLIDSSAPSTVQVVGKYLVYKHFNFDLEKVEVRLQSFPLPSPRSIWRWITLGTAT